MKKTYLTLFTALLMAGSINASAHDSVGFSISIGQPIYYSAPPVYYAPPPVYYARPTTYYVSQPAYYEAYRGDYREHAYRRDYDEDRHEWHHQRHGDDD